MNPLLAGLAGIIPVYRGVDYHYVRISDTPRKDRARLKEWMYGQTMPWLPGMKLQDGIYWDDYLRFLEGRPVVD